MMIFHSYVSHYQKIFPIFPIYFPYMSHESEFSHIKISKRQFSFVFCESLYLVSPYHRDLNRINISSDRCEKAYGCLAPPTDMQITCVYTYLKICVQNVHTVIISIYRSIYPSIHLSIHLINPSPQRCLTSKHQSKQSTLPCAMKASTLRSV